MIKNEESLEYVLPKVREYIGDKILIAHNAPFDLTILNKAFLDNNLPICPKSICTMQFFSNLKEAGLLEGEDNKLSTLCKVLGIKQVQAHRAANDARVTAEAFVKMHKINPCAFDIKDYTNKKIFEGKDDKIKEILVIKKDNKYFLNNVRILMSDIKIFKALRDFGALSEEILIKKYNISSMHISKLVEAKLLLYIPQKIGDNKIINKYKLTRISEAYINGEYKFSSM